MNLLRIYPPLQVFLLGYSGKTPASCESSLWCPFSSIEYEVCRNNITSYYLVSCHWSRDDTTDEELHSQCLLYGPKLFLLAIFSASLGMLDSRAHLDSYTFQHAGFHELLFCSSHVGLCLVRLRHIQV